VSIGGSSYDDLPNSALDFPEHASQQLPYGRARCSFISLSFTCKLLTASAGTGRSSGNRLRCVALLLLIEHLQRLAPSRPYRERQKVGGLLCVLA
jgi:hypothetical protein